MANSKKEQNIDTNIEVQKAQALIDSVKKKEQDELKGHWEYLSNYMKENNLVLNAPITVHNITKVVDDVVKTGIHSTNLNLQFLK